MQGAHLNRRLKAVLIADVVGYSRLMNVDEEATHVRLSDYVKELIEPNILSHRGRLIRSMGDGFLVEFDSAADAVNCALGIQDWLAEHPTPVASERIQLRIGINTGDVIADDRDIYGNIVNIAARLEALAGPGQIYVTRGVRDQLEGNPGLAFEDKGERRVKNIDRPIRVYRVTHAADAKRRLWPAPLAAFGRLFDAGKLRLSSRATLLATLLLAIVATLGATSIPGWRYYPRLAPRASIVVLPFRNLSSDPADEYFADAVTDDLTTDLSRLPGTFVIARGTAFTYKGKAVDARQVGQECGVRYLLQGNIKRVEGQVETNAWLVDTESAAQIWADRFDDKAADIFHLENAITGRIASSLNVQLVAAEARRNVNPNPDATDLRIRGMALYFASITPEHSREARRYLEQAVRRDPQSAEAWGWLGEILASQYLNRWNDAGKRELDEAEEAVRFAVKIDPNLAQPHIAEGLVRRARGEHRAALEAFDRALDLDPNLARAYAEKGNELTLVGHPGEAPALAEKALKLSPRDPSIGGFYWIIGRAYFFAGDYHAAIPWLRKAVAARPYVWYNRLYLVSAYALTDQDQEAKKILQEFSSNPQFAGYTLHRVEANETASPNDNVVVVSARQKLHEGLKMAGMAAQ